MVQCRQGHQHMSIVAAAACDADPQGPGFDPQDAGRDIIERMSKQDFEGALRKTIGDAREHLNREAVARVLELVLRDLGYQARVMPGQGF